MIEIDMSIEIWKELPADNEFYIHYEVSNYGNIRNKYAKNTLSLFENDNGYLRAALWNKSKKKMEFIHKLVMLTFIGERPDGLIIRHYPDQNPKNNKLDNLSYDTQTQNNYDRIENETYNCAKLTPELVLEIKNQLSNGITGQELSIKYDISMPVITNIKHNEIWQNIGDDISQTYTKFAKTTNANIDKIFEMNSAGYSNIEIADAIGRSASMVYKTLRGIHNKR